MILYMVSAVLFIRGIKLLGKADTARKGNLLSSVGMLIAVVTVLAEKDVTGSGIMGYGLVIAGVAVGAVIGAVWAKKVEMTGMPQLVALFNGFGGLSSLLVALTQYANSRTVGTDAEPFEGITLGLTIAIGAIAFTGSVVAWGKLSGKAFKKNITIPAKNVLNACLAVVGLAGAVLYAFSGSNTMLGFVGILIVTIAYLVLGYTMVRAIGGGDMPVIISLLNAFSGLAAAGICRSCDHKLGSGRRRLPRRHLRSDPDADHVQGDEPHTVCTAVRQLRRILCKEGRIRRGKGTEGNVRRGRISDPRSGKLGRVHSGLRHGCCTGTACCQGACR